MNCILILYRSLLSSSSSLHVVKTKKAKWPIRGNHYSPWSLPSFLSTRSFCTALPCPVVEMCITHIPRIPFNQTTIVYQHLCIFMCACLHSGPDHEKEAKTKKNASINLFLCRFRLSSSLLFLRLSRQSRWHFVECLRRWCWFSLIWCFRRINIENWIPFSINIKVSNVEQSITNHIGF